MSYTLEGGAVDYPAARIADRGAANGVPRWARAPGSEPAGPQPVPGIGLHGAERPAHARLASTSGRPVSPAATGARTSGRDSSRQSTPALS